MIGTLDRLAAVIGDEAFRHLGARELKVIMVALAHANMAGVAWPSAARISDLSGVDERDVRRTLRSLESWGLLEGVHGPARRFRVAPGATEESRSQLATIAPRTRPASPVAVWKETARKALRAAVASGQVRRPSRCSRCGAEGRPEGHHTDYSKPLAVVWLCGPCHRDEHRQREAAS